MGAICALPAAAQVSDTPLSAIDWLREATPAPASRIAPNEPGTASEIARSEVTVTALDDPSQSLDGIGLIPAAITGLPPTLWGASRPEDLAHRLRQAGPRLLPALQSLLYRLILAELDPPTASNDADHLLLLARIDKLMELGAVEQAEALLARAGPADAGLLARWFDAALLIGEEGKVCAALLDKIPRSPGQLATIFCTARAGDWARAALLLENGAALGLIEPAQRDLMARFLDPDLFEGDPPPPLPRPMTPLAFRLFEAIGEPVPTQRLPLAYAPTDLRDNIGWKARLEAAERLARTGAVADNKLIGLYTERRAAASGGVWERVRAVRELEAALATNDTQKLTQILPDLWRELNAAGTLLPIAERYGPALAKLPLEGQAADIARKMGLLSPEYESVALAGPEDFLASVARGLPGKPQSARERAIRDGFAATQPPARLASLMDSNRLGEAILRAILLFEEGRGGDFDGLADAIALLRMVGLEDTARRAALEFLLLEPR
ncbi:MAG: hypothetical protein CR993_07580 [Rhodobacterales bacterium]|nr:MAG: hypothetical protein CR993_07580 [Rhodobacterales bacterium]